MTKTQFLEFVVEGKVDIVLHMKKLKLQCSQNCNESTYSAKTFTFMSHVPQESIHVHKVVIVTPLSLCT